MSDQIAEALLIANGISAETGQYSIAPMREEELVARIRGEVPPENLRELEIRRRQAENNLLGTKAGINPTRIEEAGWGIVFSEDADPAVKEALSALIELRKQQAGEFFRLYEGDQGVIDKESKTDFLAKHGMGPGPADPDKVPYYLLLVGSPEAIPYRFQSQLDVQYAVGRLHFDSVQEYANYARSVVAAESGAVKLPRKGVFFGVANDDDPATQLSAQEMISKLHQKYDAEWSDWELHPLLHQEASRANLEALLNGDDAPALLFTASHGVDFKPNSDLQIKHQGALLCAEWPGPEKWAGRGQIPAGHYFSADHLEGNANLLGLIAFFYACFSAGTPLKDEFSQRFPNQTPKDLTPFPFVARLPAKMLSLPRGGALAVVGHVERTWPFSFRWREAGTQLLVYEDMLFRLHAGEPIGHTVAKINERYAELSTVLNDAIEAAKNDPNHQVNAGRLARWWMANNDARGYALIGDPAVRLPVAGADETGKLRPEMQPIEVSGPAPAETSADGNSASSNPAGSRPQTRPASASIAEDPLLPFSPLPQVPDAFADQHPELYAAWIEHIKSGYRNNDQIFRRVLNAFMRSHNITLAMYVLIFLVGISFFVAALILALFLDAPVAGAVFGGLSVGAFIAYFLTRPAQAVEENLQFITWLGIIYNSYWTRLAWAFDADTSQEVLNTATKEAIEQLNALIDKHAAASGKRPGQDAG